MNSLHKPTLLAILFALLGSFALTGCNTMNGVGKDVERAGEKIQDNSK
jgi:predicted small secreted protein